MTSATKKRELRQKTWRRPWWPRGPLEAHAVSVVILREPGEGACREHGGGDRALERPPGHTEKPLELLWEKPALPHRVIMAAVCISDPSLSAE